MTGEGEVTRRRPGTRERLWSVTWSGARLEYAGEGSFGGSMQGVRGVIYENDRPVSTFEADAAQASKESNVLKVSGNVRVVVDEFKVNVTCDQIEWRPDDNVVAASGAVRVVMPGFELGPVPRVLSTPAFQHFATDELFRGGDS
jgi:hypothetical protein